MSLIIKETDQGWISVALNRPDKRNALNTTLIQNLKTFFSSIKSKSSVRGVLLKGEGVCFSAGADLHWLKDNKKDSYLLFDLLESVSNSPVPVIAYAHGKIYGGGIGLLCACDWICAEKKTTFCFSELQLGLIPAIIAPFVLRKVPRFEIRPLILGAEIFDAQKGKDFGFLNYVGSERNCHQWMKAKVKSLTKLNLSAFGKTKNLIDSFWSIKDQKDFCIQLLDEQRGNKQVQERILRFLNS